MDPELKSVLTTILGYAGAAAATWGVARGLVPAEDKAAFANIIATAVPTAVAAGVALYKKHLSSPAAVIAQVNAADNGVKVVAATVPETVAPTVNGPLRASTVKGTKP